MSGLKTLQPEQNSAISVWLRRFRQMFGEAEVIDIGGVLKAFNQFNVRYCVIGGLAVYHHGYHRVTDDMDFIIADEEENRSRVVDALKSLEINPGATPIGRHLYKDFLVDISTFFKGVGWRRAIESAEDGAIDGVPCKIVSKEHLIYNKKAVGRLQDLADVERLEGRSQDYIPSEGDK
jgi:hypothetical protein